MDRLTNKVLDNAIDTYKAIIKTFEGTYISEGYNLALDKCTLSFLEELNEYRHLEEQGKLNVSPFNILDDIWCLCEYGCGFVVCGYSFMAICDDYCIVTTNCDNSKNHKEVLENMENITKNDGYQDEIMIFHKSKVFASKAEAEKALEEMKGE